MCFDIAWKDLSKPLTPNDILKWPRGELNGLFARALAEISTLCEENERLQQHVNDLQSGMYVNCVYCGHRYGPNRSTPVSMAEVLKQHVEQCPKHPMAHLKKHEQELLDLLTDVWIQYAVPAVVKGEEILSDGCLSVLENVREILTQANRIYEKTGKLRR